MAVSINRGSFYGCPHISSLLFGVYIRAPEFFGNHMCWNHACIQKSRSHGLWVWGWGWVVVSR